MTATDAEILAAATTPAPPRSSDEEILLAAGATGEDLLRHLGAAAIGPDRPDARLLGWGPGRAIAEYAPARHVIRYRENPYDRGGPARRYQLEFPWVVVCHQLTTTIALRNTPVGGLDDPLFILPLPHVEASGTVCYDSGAPHGAAARAAVGLELCDQWYGAFLTTLFLGGYHWRVTPPPLPTMRGGTKAAFLAAWERLTADTVCQVTWSRLRRWDGRHLTLRSLVARGDGFVWLI